MNTLKKLIEKNFENMKKMSVREYLTYRKWEQLNLNPLSAPELLRLSMLKKSLWYPDDPDDYLKLQPDLVFADNKADIETWVMLRNFIHAQVHNNNIGRSIKAFVIDRNTKKYLGIIALHSDFISLKPREKHIGWTVDHKIKHKRLNFTAIGSTICPTQPLGFNYTGGKLMAFFTCCDKIVNKWNQKYNKQALVGITTTSLFGRPSQYTRLKYWKDCGDTKGKIPLEPSENIYIAMREWMKKMYPEEYRKITHVELHKKNITTRPKGRIIAFVLAKMQIKPPENNAPRGVYFCSLYKETKEFLRMEKLKIKAEPAFDNRLPVLFDLWKNRYAKNRIKNTKDRIGEHLFYDDMIGSSWKDTRKKYI